MIFTATAGSATNVTSSSVTLNGAGIPNEAATTVVFEWGATTGYDYNQVRFIAAGWPSLGDTPVVGDYDGDEKADPGIWRASQGIWIIPLSTGHYATYRFCQWGQQGDIALPNTTGRR
ncbi:MAG: hypothetical protein WBN92_18870 [Terriglobia bacterium]